MDNINNDELDLVTFSDEDGNEFEMEVWDYFEHEGQEYAILLSFIFFFELSPFILKQSVFIGQDSLFCITA